MELYLV
jgi:hypothetical protein